MRRSVMVATVAVSVSLFFGSLSLQTSSAKDSANTNVSTGAVPDLRGVWSGAFQSKNRDTAPFTLTVKLDADGQGRFVGKATHDSRCLKDVDLQVTLNSNSEFALAGSDDEGNSMTLLGTLDPSGTLLTLRYIINGSAGGRCELDNGTGTLGKR
jgi:hypothetical protein